MSRPVKLILSAIVVGAYALLAVGSTDGGSTTGSFGTSSEPKRVEYKVTGSAFDITINNSQGNTEQLSNVAGPWSRSFTVTELPFFAYVSAQNQRRSGTIVAEIYVDGVRVERARSSGEFVIASVSTSVR